MKTRAIISAAALLAVCPVSGFGVELVTNGGFDGVFTGWSRPAAAETWEGGGYEAGLQALDLSLWGVPLPETLISQPLNLPLQAGDELEVSVDVLRYGDVPEGRAVAVYLEFLDAQGGRHSVLALNPDNGEVTPDEWTTFRARHVPQGMSKLVGVRLDVTMEVWGLFADNVSVSAPRGGGPTPQLGRVSPAAVAYTGHLVLEGEHFGETEGRVLAGGSAEGLGIVYWSDSAIVVRVADPCVGGELVVEAGGVSTWQPRRLVVSSPHYSLALHPSRMVVVPGQKIQVPVYVDFRNGFEPADGIRLEAPVGPGSFSICTPEVVVGRGGSILNFDTAGLEPGLHEIRVTGMGGGLNHHSATMTLDVREIGLLQLTYSGGEGGYGPLDGAEFTETTSVGFYVEIRDTEGRQLFADMHNSQLPVPVVSSDPAVADVCLVENGGPWANPQVLVLGSGDVTLTVTSPDGRTWPTRISASIPDGPSIVAAGFGANPMINSPGTENSFWWEASDAMSRASWGFGSLGGSITGGDWVEGNKGYAGTFAISEHPADPGCYVFHGGGTVDGQAVSAYRKLQVVNAPEKGMLRGMVAAPPDGREHFWLGGTLSLLDPETGEVRHQWEDLVIYGGKLQIPHVEPGSYKVRWQLADQGFGDQLPAPLWYPSATTFEKGGVVTITAGGVEENINFVFMAPAVEPTAPEIVGAPVMDLASGVFSMSIETEEGAVYELQKSESLLDNSWWTVDQIWGNGEAQTLSDDGATGPKAYYRVKRK